MTKEHKKSIEKMSRSASKEDIAFALTLIEADEHYPHHPPAKQLWLKVWKRLQETVYNEISTT